MIRRVFRKKRDTFDLDNLGIYQCPLFIGGRNIQKDREHHLKTEYGPTNIAWETYINSIYLGYKKGELSCIKEFPFPIANKFRHREIARKVANKYCKTDDEKSQLINKIWNKIYYIVDYHFYNLGLVVELDSHFHDDKPLEDFIRDLYLEEEYGIRTLRVVGYGVRNDTKADNKFNNKFKRVVKDIRQQKEKAGYEVEDPIEVDYTSYLNDKYKFLEYGNESLAILAEEIYEEFVSKEDTIIVPKDWIKDRDVDKEKLADYFYEQYFRKLTFENP